MASAMTRIIHLADIHFGRDHCFSAGDKDGVEYLTKGSLAESLIDDIKSIGSTPDLVIVSGDLTSSGGRQEYNEAELFLKELSQKLNLDTSRFLIVPGNHDVFWGADPATVSNGDYLAFASRFFQLWIRRHLSFRLRLNQITSCRTWRTRLSGQKSTSGCCSETQG
jgi:3',5'-cyclic AMP phosphodiesterase CpdA